MVFRDDSAVEVVLTTVLMAVVLEPPVERMSVHGNEGSPLIKCVR